jgi:hypothetical protein
MVCPRKILVAVAMLAVALPAFAADSAGASNVDLAALANAQAARQSLAGARALAQAQRGVTTAGSARPQEVYLSASHAYPPSCFPDGLPFGSQLLPGFHGYNLQTVQGFLLPGDPLSTTAGEPAYSELVTVSVWQVDCSGGTSATVIEIDRPSTASLTLYPIFPYITYTQGTLTATPPRLPADPNTFFSDTAPASPLYASNIWVLDKYQGQVAAPNFNQAFTLTVNNLTGGEHTFTFPAYLPPTSPLPLEISGYVSGPYYQPGKGGEGMLVQVYDNGDRLTRTFAATWYTFDATGVPFWLYAQASFSIFDSSQNVTTQLNSVPVYYQTGGGFAGNFTSSHQNSWGTMNVSFPNCSSMKFTYNGAATQVTGGPSGTGTQTWTRIANINGLVCQ